LAFALIFSFSRRGPKKKKATKYGEGKEDKYIICHCIKRNKWDNPTNTSKTTGSMHHKLKDYWEWAKSLVRAI
jgi:hypothetical protein